MRLVAVIAFVALAKEKRESDSISILQYLSNDTTRYAAQAPVGKILHRNAEPCCEVFKIGLPQTQLVCTDVLGQWGWDRPINSNIEHTCEDTYYKALCTYARTHSVTGMMEYSCEPDPEFQPNGFILPASVQYVEHPEYNGAPAGSYFALLGNMPPNGQDIEPEGEEVNIRSWTRALPTAGANCPSMNNWEILGTGLNFVLECVTQCTSGTCTTDMCQSGDHNCGEATCVSTDDSFSCECQDGFELTIESNTHTCTDINECFANPCRLGPCLNPCGSAPCTNTVGSFTCGDNVTPTEQLTEMMNEALEIINLHGLETNTRFYNQNKRILRRLNRKVDAKRLHLTQNRGCNFREDWYWKNYVDHTVAVDIWDYYDEQSFDLEDDLCEKAGKLYLGYAKWLSIYTDNCRRPNENGRPNPWAGGLRILTKFLTKMGQEICNVTS